MRYFFFVFLLAHQLYAQERSACFGGEAKFLPQEGKKILILGQDLGAVGGLNNYSDGYVDAFNYYPAGVTTYTNIGNLQGLTSKTNYGAGDVNAQRYLEDENFSNTAIAVGLYLVGEEQNIINGNRDYNIKKLAKWVKDTKRPIYLRIGYEFDGPHNNYNSSSYVKMYQHIVDVFDQEEVTNCDFVWQSDGIHDVRTIKSYYPGDDYVDWMAFSYFNKGAGVSILDFAMEKGKPVMIAEATPMGFDLDNNEDNVWEDWFVPMFELIDNNEAIKALAYINVDWNAQPMWKNSDINWGDSRIQKNTTVLNKWNEKIDNGSWLKSEEELFTKLGYPFSVDNECFSVINSLGDEDLGIRVYSESQDLIFKIPLDLKVDKIQIFELITGKMINTQSSDSNTKQVFNNLEKGLFTLVMTTKDGDILTKKIAHK